VPLLLRALKANGLLWVYLVLWEQLDCQNAGVTLSVAAKAARTAW